LQLFEDWRDFATVCRAYLIPERPEAEKLEEAG
jgi:hypothetical protein